MSSKRRYVRLASLKSIDDRTAVMAFLIFLVVVLFIFDAVSNQQALKQAESEKEPVLTKELADSIMAKFVIDSKEKDGVGFIVKDTVDPDLLDHVASMDYEELKAQLGIQADFAIYFEDEDGMVIPIGDKMCIGSRDALINGVPCGYGSQSQIAHRRSQTGGTISQKRNVQSAAADLHARFARGDLRRPLFSTNEPPIIGWWKTIFQQGGVT